MPARFPTLAVFGFAAVILAGCSTDKRLYSAEREDGRTVALDWWIGERIETSKLNADGGPPLAQVDAATLANDSLPRFVKTPERWTLAYIHLVELKKGCFAWAVRFDRKGAFEDGQAADKFIKFYVLFDRSVVVPTLMYDN